MCAQWVVFITVANNGTDRLNLFSHSSPMPCLLSYWKYWVSFLSLHPNEGDLCVGTKGLLICSLGPVYVEKNIPSWEGQSPYRAALGESMWCVQLGGPMFNSVCKDNFLLKLLSRKWLYGKGNPFAREASLLINRPK